MKKYILTLLLSVGVFSAGTTHAANATAILAGGCFWCVEADFEKLDGVIEAVSGFTGGTHPDPTYNGRHDGHYEAVLITYDPEIVDYQGLLDHFWINHDPFDARGQFCDKGHEYLAAIFVGNEEERELAEKSRQAVIDMFPNQTVVTPILDRVTFYPIKGDESYHQDFYKKSPLRYRFYRNGCGRDARLDDIWGDKRS